MVAAPTLQATSSCEPVPPEQPIAPMSLPVLHQRDPAARGDDPIERHHIVEIALLNGVLEHLLFATEGGGSARLVLGDLD